MIPILAGVAALNVLSGLIGSESSGNITITKQSDAASSNNASSGNGSLAASNSSNQDPAVKSFLDYMKKSPAERIRDAWLQAHHLTEDDLKNMSPAEREAIEKQMAADLKAQMQQQAQAKTPATANAAPGLAKLLSANL